MSSASRNLGRAGAAGVWWPVRSAASRCGSPRRPIRVRIRGLEEVEPADHLVAHLGRDREHPGMGHRKVAAGQSLVDQELGRHLVASSLPQLACRAAYPTGPTASYQRVQQVGAQGRSAKDSNSDRFHGQKWGAAADQWPGGRVGVGLGRPAGQPGRSRWPSLEGAFDPVPGRVSAVRGREHRKGWMTWPSHAAWTV